VIGLGRSGKGAAILLNSEGNSVIVLEQSEESSFNESAKELRDKGIIVKLGKPLEMNSFNPWIEQISSVIVSPGIPWEHKILKKLRELNINVKSEVALAWQRLKHLPWIGITGTNGKTTATYMLNHILESNSLNAPIGGNVGTSATEITHKYKTNKDKSFDWLIMELSSYQIEATPELAPDIGIWTTLTPDHLERHGSLDKYFAIKKTLIENSKTRIYNADDFYINQNRKSLKKGIWVSTLGPGSQMKPNEYWINKKGYVVERNKELFHSNVLKIPGNHNKQNMLLVIAAARKIGLDPKKIEDSINTFEGVPHRLEKIACIDGSYIFNDSKATNYESALAGLITVTPPTIVIAGGQAKQGDSSHWLKSINERAYGIVLYGYSAKDLEFMIKKSSFKGHIIVQKTLYEAVQSALFISKKGSCKSILFSPACASFDQYKDYEERGNHFKEIIKNHIISS
tara:strand:+ start:275 stop:1645 length:1371 start_codon:yes stop_codon:yes gene_type:complete